MCINFCWLLPYLGAFVSNLLKLAKKVIARQWLDISGTTSGLSEETKGIYSITKPCLLCLAPSAWIKSVEEINKRIASKKPDRSIEYQYKTTIKGNKRIVFCRLEAQNPGVNSALFMLAIRSLEFTLTNLIKAVSNITTSDDILLLQQRGMNVTRQLFWPRTGYGPVYPRVHRQCTKRMSILASWQVLLQLRDDAVKLSEWLSKRWCITWQLCKNVRWCSTSRSRETR